ncbi:DUF4135 domain-containing protein [Nocardioides sp. ChNu-99]|uniref:DUF4135 domain-containing protein n=1 Tax=Nocardioides sp. ChNu-99 TaxID=2839897 RepID=UPI002405496C|nr:DUF4135 domain-containing protein [Nocardioides sp. ChNu-99]MDF9717198.1 DUF4135 domain-containing protein [Nocardioides sp. ChNu-99]
MDTITETVVDVLAPVLHRELAASSSTDGTDGTGPRGERAGVPDAVVHDAARALLLARVASLVSRVTVVEFHAFREARGWPADPASTRAMEAWTAGFDAAEVAGWFERYPALATLLDRVAANTGRAVAEAADRVVADRDALVAAGMLPADAGPLVRLAHLDSDPHRGGRMVMGLTFASGARLVYKPRTLAGDAALRACLRLISRDLPHDLTACVPAALDRGTHGWQEHVVPAPAADHRDADTYYWRFGALAALLGPIGATDLHEENVMAVRDRPVLVDLETVLHAERSTGSLDVADGLGDRVRRSVAGTLMFPQRMPTGPYSVVLGGVGIPYDQESSRTEFVVEDGGTDGVDIARRTYTFLRRQHVLAFADGRVSSVLDHYAALQDGFTAGYRSVVAHRREILGHLTARPFTLRQIVRPTGTYARLLNAATHPDLLRDPAELDRFLARLQPPLGLKLPHVARFIAEVERASLAEGDIPYFTVDSDDYRLLGEDARSVPFTDHTPADWAWLGLRDMSEDDLLFERLLVEDGMSEMRRLRARAAEAEGADTAGAPRDTLPVDVAPLVSGPGAAGGIDWRPVRALLRRAAVRTPGVDGAQRGWVTGLHADSLPTYDIGSAVALHDAGGIGVFLDRAARAEGPLDTTDELGEVRRGQAALVRRYRESLEQLPLSVISGRASLAYGAQLTAPGAAGVLPLVEAALGLDGRGGLDAERLAADDLTRGLPGAGLVLAGDPAMPLATLERALAATARHGVPDRAEHDLAHGTLGVLWARAAMARRLGDERELRRAVDGVLAVAAVDPPRSARGWCSGAAALALVLAETVDEHQDVTRLRHLAERAAAPLVASAGPVDLSVCHGAAGVVQVLLHVAQRLDASWALDLADACWRSSAHHAAEHGFFTGDRAKTAVLGYFHGWAGIADTALLLELARRGERPWVPAALQVAPYLVVDEPRPARPVATREGSR